MEIPVTGRNTSKELLLDGNQPQKVHTTIMMNRYAAPSRYIDPPKYPEFSDGKRRIESFKKGKVAPGHTPEALAEAGWFFIGPGDKVQCFHCGGILREWEPDDDPWDEHKTWFANCSYINTQRSAATRRQLQEQIRSTTTTLATDAQFKVEPRKVKARMDTAKVRAILDMGYSRELVRKTIEDRLSTTGDDFPNAESLLEALFLIEATNPITSASGFISTTSSPLDHIAGRLPLMPSSSTTAVSSSSSTSSTRSTPICNNSQHFTDSHSLPAPSQSSTDTSTSVFPSLVSRPTEQLPASATVSAVIPQESAADKQSNSKGKRKRNRKKKTSGAPHAAATGDEDQRVEAVSRAQYDPGNLAQLEDLNLKEINYKKTSQYVEEIRRLREARTCKVCMDAEVNTVFLPCGHLVCCSSCSPQLRYCPICRTFIRGTVKTFLA